MRITQLWLHLAIQPLQCQKAKVPSNPANSVSGCGAWEHPHEDTIWCTHQDPQHMHTSPITQSTTLEIHCPHCLGALLTVEASGCTVVGQKSWLLDGDEIPGLPGAVQWAGSDYSLSSMLTVGQCWSCAGRYYTVDCTFVPGTDETLLIDWLAGEVEADADPVLHSCQAAGLPSPWLLVSTDTHLGQVFEHTLGPFRLERASDVIGPSGVSSCGSRANQAPWLNAKTLVTQQLNVLSNINQCVTAPTRSPSASGLDGTTST